MNGCRVEEYGHEKNDGGPPPCHQIGYNKRFLGRLMRAAMVGICRKKVRRNHPRRPKLCQCKRYFRNIDACFHASFYYFRGRWSTAPPLVDRPGGAATYHLDVLLFLRCYLVVSKRALLLWLKHAVDVFPYVARLFVGRVLDEHTAWFVNEIVCVVPDAVEVLGVKRRD